MSVPTLCGARSDAGLPRAGRLALTLVLLVAAMGVATRFGLVSLIARGYRALAVVFLAIYVLPVLTLAVWRLRRPLRPVLPALAQEILRQ